MVRVRPAATPIENLQDHRPRHHVAPGEVLRGGRVAFHEALAVLVDEVAALAPATLRHQHPGAVDAGGMELPHLDVLHRHPGAQRHGNAIAGVDVGVGGAGVDAPGAAGGEHRGAGFDERCLAGLDANGDDAHHRPVAVLHQIHREPLGEEHRAGAHIVLVERVQHGMAGAIRRGAGARRLPALAVVLGLAAERALIDAPVFVARERQAHVLQLVHGLRAGFAHVFDGVLVADVVRPFHGVVHVPAPIVFGIFAADGASDAALRRNGVRARWEHLGKHRHAQAGAGEFQPGAQTGAAAADDHAVELHRVVGRQRSLHTMARPHAT